MSDFTSMVLSNGLALNQRLAWIAANSIDWIFKRDTLIQSGRTWFELVHDGDLMAVRYYGLPDESEIQLVDGTTKPIEREQYDVPLVLVPPLGVTTETFDLMPQRSLVRYMAASGFKTYLVDWGKPGRQHARLDLRDYSYSMLGDALQKVREHSGSDTVSMMGWCMGGLLCLLHQGQVQDPNVRNIITVASPIDMESGRGAIAGLAGAAFNLDGPAKLVSNYTKLRVKALDPARLAVPPWLTTLAFKMTDPVGSVTSYWDLVTRLSDREYVKSFSTTSDYLNHMLLYPGGVLQDMAVKVAGENQLAKGRVEVRDEVARLDDIRSNLLVFAGETDILVPAEIAEKVVEIVPSQDKEFRLAPGGHMGVIIGSKAQNAVWAQSAQWLASRSVLGPKKVGTEAKSNKVGKANGRVTPKSKTESRSKAGRKISATSKPGTRAKAKAKVKLRTKAESKTKARPKTKAKSNTRAKSGIQTKSKVSATLKKKSIPKTRAKAKTKTTP